MDKYLKANIVFSKFVRTYSELKKDLPIRPSEMGVLNIITRREGKFTPNMISELLEVSKPMVASHILKLEKKGYITKEFLEKDKRSYYIIPTKKAIELVYVTEQRLNENLIRLDKKLGSVKFDELLLVLEEARNVLEVEEDEEK